MKVFFRVVYKAQNSQLESRNVHSHETAHRIAANLNKRFQGNGQHIVEGVPVSELEPDQLARLFREKLITYRELATYAGTEVAERELKLRYSSEISV